ncbi:MAG: [FeFe] hydrogenase H-cluster maturation GTPase HydF [Lachnospiraceae bacterium]|jgi:[FeFe] hydrogenase H-cluster maturation GTPase HydF|nr:[FeFe] hydrogenase H-cluster maturation GTPase HydF [Lachnospiraceae bacterium]
MSLNSTPFAERVHIGFFGKRNAGKSSVVNAVAGQELAVVSEVSGTTTDPVQKAMELLPVGPVVIIDTPGIDDEGALGELRVRKTRQILNKTDVAVLVVDQAAGFTSVEQELAGLFQEKGIPYLVAVNKADLQGTKEALEQTGGMWMENGQQWIQVSAKTGFQIQELKERIAGLVSQEGPSRRIIGDLLHPGDFVVLVTPIDNAAPKGRLILPQQQTIRDILDSDAVAITVKENELKGVLQQLGKKPAMVVTDSQVFAKVSADTPKDLPLTSFSILFARYKGNLQAAVHGAAAIELLEDGDKVLISEGCTHHRQCDDIGSVKLPRWLKEYTNKQIQVSLSSGMEFPEDLSGYKLVVHCGGCMLNEREMKYRVKCAMDQGVPMTNYGTAIAYMKGILRRSVELFPEALRELSE